MKKLRQWAREVRDSYKVCGFGPLPWEPEKEIGHWRGSEGDDHYRVRFLCFDLWLDHTPGCAFFDIDWTWLLLRFDLGLWRFSMGLVDND